MPEKYVLPIIEVGLLKTCVRREDDLRKNWSTRWGWMLDEYKALKKTIATVTDTSVLIVKEKSIDLRTIQPIPESVNHEYGWLVSKPEFNLEVYGGSLLTSPPLPPEYRLVPPRFPS